MDKSIGREDQRQAFDYADSYSKMQYGTLSPGETITYKLTAHGQSSFLYLIIILAIFTALRAHFRYPNSDHAKWVVSGGE